ncbi:MAG: macro domain-containing protein [Desulfuromonadales bacterium]
MREVACNLWELHENGAIVCITTNGAVSRRGRAQLLRGCARQAAERFPDLASRLGALIASEGNHVHDLGDGLVSFPVEETPYDNPDSDIIRRSAMELVKLADRRHWREIILPRPGCGSGGLDWKDVRPRIEPLLDDRFVVITYREANHSVKTSLATSLDYCFDD